MEDKTTIPNPPVDKNPTTATNNTVAMGINMGLKNMRIGVRNTNPTTVPVNVRPVKSSKTEPETNRVMKPKI